MAEKLVFKVVVVGNGSIGKTSLIRRFVHDKFEKEYLMTIGTEVTKYNGEVDGNEITFIIWDLAGQQGFAQMRKNFYNGANAAIVVFSHEPGDTGDKSLTSIPTWLEDITKFSGKIPTILFGNKIDLIDNDELASNNDLQKSDYNINKLTEALQFLGYFKTSALSGEGVESAFNTLMVKLYGIYQEEQSRPKRKMEF